MNSPGTVHFSCKTNTQTQEQGENTGEKCRVKKQRKKIEREGTRKKK
jgi:hypothetical protein